MKSSKKFKKFKRDIFISDSGQLFGNYFLQILVSRAWQLSLIYFKGTTFRFSFNYKFGAKRHLD